MSQFEKLRVIISVSVSIGLLAGSVYAKELAADLPMVNLSQKFYFKDLQGEPVLVNSGEYVVDAAENGIQLTPITGQGNAIVIEAERTVVQESLVLSTINRNPDLQSFMVVMPGGIIYEAVGSSTGIWTRGLLGKIRQAKNRQRGECPRTARCKRPSRKGAKTLGNFHKAEHLKATATTLCRPIKGSPLQKVCEENVGRALLKTRFSPPTKVHPFKKYLK